MSAPKLSLVPDQPNEGGTIRMSVDAADAIAARLDSQEHENKALREENGRLKGHINMMDRASELLAQERDRLKKQNTALQEANGKLVQKLIEYHESQRTPEQNESLADQIDAARAAQ